MLRGLINVSLVIYIIAPADFTEASGTLTVSEDDTVECVSITIISDTEDEDNRECFALAISITDTEGVSLETTQATVCITDDDGIAIISANAYATLSLTFYV